MISATGIKKGSKLLYKDEPYIVIDFQHVKPGKGGAFVRTKLKNLRTGKVLAHTFPAGTKIDDQRVERRKYQFLYKQDTIFHFMNSETFEQTFFDEDLLDAPDLLKEGVVVEILFHVETETPLICDMSAYVELEVTYTEPGEKGNTATNAFKNATVETGAIIKVPLFINIGDKIKIDTRTSQYSERVK